MALNAFTNIFRIAELRSRLLYTLALLAVYRLGIFITTPGVDRAAMNAFMDAAAASGGLVSLFNMFSGGALEQMSIFALGIMPYVSASIIMQLLAVVVPTLERLQKEGERGPAEDQPVHPLRHHRALGRPGLRHRALARLARPGHRPSQAAASSRWSSPTTTLWFTFMTVITLTAGTAFIMWLGEQITERGIGNGISLIIFAGIVARLPRAAKQLYELVSQDVVNVGAVLGAGGVHAGGRRRWSSSSSAGMRRIPVQYAKRMVGRQMFARPGDLLPAEGEHLGRHPAHLRRRDPLVPGDAGQLAARSLHDGAAGAARAAPGSTTASSSLLIVFFTYFYTALTFHPDDVADNIKKHGGYIPGIRPGRQTAEYIERVLNRITFGGAHLPGGHLRLPSILTSLLGRAVPLRRHRAAHRGGRGARHRPADRGPPHQPQLRGLHRAARPAHPRPLDGLRRRRIGGAAPADAPFAQGRTP